MDTYSHSLLRETEQLAAVLGTTQAHVDSRRLSAKPRNDKCAKENMGDGEYNENIEVMCTCLSSLCVNSCA